MNPISIIVLDDHALIIEAIKALIEESKTIRFIEGFQTSKSLFHFLENNTLPDILLLDIQLKEEDGIEVCKLLTQKYTPLKILMLSSLTQSAIVVDALKKGAKGYLPKNINKEDLIEACYTLMEGKTYLHKDISFLPIEEKNSRFNYIPKLTRREKEVLTLIMEEFTTNEIADKLNITISTVETHRASLFSKTDSKNVVGLIKYTLKKGLLDN